MLEALGSRDCKDYGDLSGEGVGQKILDNNNKTITGVGKNAHCNKNKSMTNASSNSVDGKITCNKNKSMESSPSDVVIGLSKINKTITGVGREFLSCFDKEAHYFIKQATHSNSVDGKITCNKNKSMESSPSDVVIGLSKTNKTITDTIREAHYAA